MKKKPLYDIQSEPQPSWYWKREITTTVLGKPIKKTVNTMYIEMVEHLLHSIFINWKSKVVSFTLTDKLAVVHINLTCDTKSHDGLGVAEIGNPDSFWGLQSPEMALPLAETVAICDAAHKLGEIFGANINRVVHDDIQAQKIATIDVDKCATIEELEALWATLDAFQQQDEFIKMAFGRRKVDIKYSNQSENRK